MGKGGQDVMFWNVLAFSNLADLKELTIDDCPPLPLDHMQKLTSLKSLEIDYSSNNNVLSLADSESDAIYRFPIERLEIKYCVAHEKELTQLLSHFQDLSELKISDCEKITRVGVVGEQQQTTRGEEEIKAGGEGSGLLLSSPHLQELVIYSCPELSLLSNSLQGLHSLRSLVIRDCPKFPSSCIWPLIAHCCLTQLCIYDARTFFAPPLAHGKELTSSKLQNLDTNDLTGFLVVPICSLLSSSITRLCLSGIDHEFERFTKEQEDAIQLLTSLQTLEFLWCDKLQCLPASLQRLSSLKKLRLEYCDAFQSLSKDSLPTSLQTLDINYCSGFRSLPNGSNPDSLRLLLICACPYLESLPKDSLPSSLQVLRISLCHALKSLPDGGLPSSLQDLEIRGCPSLKSLPHGGLPSSLWVLDVRNGNNSEELMRQCRKLKGSIPIIKD